MHSPTTPAAVEAARYRATPRQLALLAAFADIATRANDTTDDAPRTPIERICERAAVPPERFAQWMRDDDFRNWWSDATASALRNRTSLVLRALTERAELGDLAAIKLWLPRFDRLDGGSGEQDRLAWLRLCRDIFD